MKTHKIGIIMNGVTGRMGTNQHLIRSIKAIIDQGGVKLSDSEIIMPDPVLVGRSEEKLKALAARVGVTRVSTNLDAELAKPDNQIYFDSTLTGQRPSGVRKAIAAKKHIYCEKPSATTASEVFLEAAMERNELMMPQTVPNRPTKGPAEATEASTSNWDSSRSTSRAMVTSSTFSIRACNPMKAEAAPEKERFHSRMAATKSAPMPFTGRCEST